MRRVPTLVAVGAMAVAAISVTVTPAAATVTPYCHSDGSDGWLYGDWASSTRFDPLELHVNDTAADGHHAAIRFVSKNNAGTTKTWSWHHIYGGKGDTGVWSTYAEDPGGIAAVTVDVGVFEGDDWLTYCRADWEYR
jgi:hypothetical protein